METKKIELNETQALTMIHLIEHEVKNVLRDTTSSTVYKDWELKELRIMHDLITNVFKNLY